MLREPTSKTLINAHQITAGGAGTAFLHEQEHGTASLYLLAISDPQNKRNKVACIAKLALHVVLFEKSYKGSPNILFDK